MKWCRNLLADNEATVYFSSEFKLNLATIGLNISLIHQTESIRLAGHKLAIHQVTCSVMVLVTELVTLHWLPLPTPLKPSLFIIRLTVRCATSTFSRLNPFQIFFVQETSSKLDWRLSESLIQKVHHCVGKQLVFAPRLRITSKGRNAVLCRLTRTFIGSFADRCSESPPVWPPSSVAKKIDLFFFMTFARRRSLFSLSSSCRRGHSSALIPCWVSSSAWPYDPMLWASP